MRATNREGGTIRVCGRRDPDEPIANQPTSLSEIRTNRSRRPQAMWARSGRTDLETQANLYVLKGPDPDEPISKPEIVLDRARSGRTDLETRV